MRSVDRDSLIAYFGSLKGPNTIAITDVQAVIDNWPDTFTAPVNQAGTVNIEEVWEDFFKRIVEWSEFLDEHTDAENDGRLREMLWELIARVLLVSRSGAQK